MTECENDRNGNRGGTRKVFVFLDELGQMRSDGGWRDAASPTACLEAKKDRENGCRSLTLKLGQPSWDKKRGGGLDASVE